MSQIIKGGVGSTPSIPTSFTTDQQDTTTASIPANVGSSVPVANTLRVAGINGIQSFEPTLVNGAIEIGFNGGTITTTGAEVKTLMTLTPIDNATTTYQILVDGFDSGNACGIGGQLVATIKKIAGVVTVIGTPDDVKNGDTSPEIPPLSGITISNAVFTAVASGADLIVQVTGVAGFTILWKAITAGVTK